MENIAHLNALRKIEHSFRFDLTNAKYFKYNKATPSHTLVSGHSQAYKWMRAGG